MKRFVLIASIFCTSVLMMAMPTSFVDEEPDRVDFEKDKVGELDFKAYFKATVMNTFCYWCKDILISIYQKTEFRNR